jgi:putative ABC transport system permease protein
MFLGLLHEALISIGASRLRTFLAVLGIVIGVASVVLMLAVGRGSQSAVEESINKLGSNLLIITAGSRNISGLQSANISDLTIKDAEAMAFLPSIIASSPSTAAQSLQVSAGKNNWNTRITGTTSDFFSIRKWDFEEGDAFSPDDIKLGKRVVVIGATVANKLFAGETALGGIIRINNMPFNVIGVLAPKGQDFGGRDQDDAIYLPITTAQNKLPGNFEITGAVQVIYAQAVSREALDFAIEELTDLLRQRHKLRENQGDDFTIRSLSSITQTASDTSRALSMLLGAIASISLIVGGIGIMNIMLVTVAERTREIGIRKAIGASDNQILLQFLFEAMLIALSGCIIGLIIGFGGGIAAHHYMNIPIEYSIWSIVLALIVAAIVGLASGIYPAYKAAKLQPIEALRAVGA